MMKFFGSFAVGAVAALALVAGSPGQAVAHVCMDFPISRVGAECTARSPQKIGSCPIKGRTEFINVFRPGETITVRLRETVNHPSHYRIAFNPDGETFPDPRAIDDINPDHPLILVDGIEDAEEAVQEVQVTLPNTPCENCTLQLIQVMYDKQRNGFGGASGGPDDNDDMYYACADIALRGAPVANEATAEAEGRLAGMPVLFVLAFAGVAGVGGIWRRRRS